MDAVVERKGAITLEGNPLTLVGPGLTVGQKAPDFRLIAPHKLLTPRPPEVTLAAGSGKVRLISVVPSLDTPVCDVQTETFEHEAGRFSEVVFYTVSADLPFAQNRYSDTRKIGNIQLLSDYRDLSFGAAYGVLIKELRLLSRAVFIVDAAGTVRYVHYVKEISQPIDYDEVGAALGEIAAGKS
jgi:thiol peroxidase